MDDTSCGQDNQPTCADYLSNPNNVPSPSALNSYWTMYGMPQGYYGRNISPWPVKKGNYLGLLIFNGMVAVSSGAPNSNYSDFKWEIGTTNRYALNFTNPRFYLTAILQQPHYHKTVELDYTILLTQPNPSYNITFEVLEGNRTISNFSFFFANKKVN